jgi:hypothetical protein
MPKSNICYQFVRYTGLLQDIVYGGPMQVVINRNSGSFALTDATLLELYRLNPGSAAIKVVSPEEAASDSLFDDMFYVKADDGNFVQAASNMTRTRSCPALVAVVRKLGAQAAAGSAQLDIIDVPDTLCVYSDMADDMLMSRVRTFV